MMFLLYWKKNLGWRIYFNYFYDKLVSLLVIGIIRELDAEFWVFMIEEFKEMIFVLVVKVVLIWLENLYK